MQKSLVVAVSVVVVLAAGVCLARKPEKPPEAPAEIKSVESPYNFEYTTAGTGPIRTTIPVLVKNNTRDRVEGVKVILHAYDKQKVKLFESKIFTNWASDSEAGRWSDGDNSIKERQTVKLLCMLPGEAKLQSKEFKEEYGDPQFFVVELYVGDELADVGAKPQNFFKNISSSNRLERLKEWEAIKGNGGAKNKDE